MTLPVLNLPLQNNRKPRPYLKPKKLRIWLLGLPVGNTLKTAQLLLQQLRMLNLSRYPIMERVQLLDAMRPYIKQSILALHQLIKKSSLPLPPDTQIYYRLLQDLLSEVACGYKQVTSDLLEHELKKEHDRLILREAVYLSIQYLARKIVHAYSIYHSPPNDCWRELHQLYRYAESQQFHLLAVDDPHPDYTLPVPYTIDLAYKRIVLLSLAAPYHLMRHEAENVYYLVSAWTAGCQIIPMNKALISDEYGVDFASDMSPRFIPDTLEWEPVDGRNIDIREVKQRLDAHVSRMLRTSLTEYELEPGHHNTLLERQHRDLLLRLADAWHGNMSRQDSRLNRGAPMRISCGLNACHYYSSRRTDFTPEMDELRLSSVDNDSLKQATVFANAYREALQKDRRHNLHKYALNPLQQKNISYTGISLYCDSGCEHIQLRVGEIVAYLFEDTTGKRWKIGIVRWLHIDNHNRIETGIMNLSNSAVPVAVKALEGLGKGTDYFRGLLIPRQVSIRQIRSLVVPFTMFDVGTVLAVNLRTRIFYVRLTRLILSTHSIAQYEFETLERPPVDVSQDPL